MTDHFLAEGDCRDLGFIEDGSIQLIVTHPPRFGVAAAGSASGQLACAGTYEDYLEQLDEVWEECARVVAPGGMMVCVASAIGRDDSELPVAADVHVRASSFGMRAVRAVRWIEPGTLDPHESCFFGGPNQPCNEREGWAQDILAFRKGGARREVSPVAELSSRMPAAFYAQCSSPVWRIARDEGQSHPESFPLELAQRIVRMFSYADDTVLDPFAGSGTTNEAAIAHGRHSVGVEVEPVYFESMTKRLADSSWPEGQIKITARGKLSPV